MYGNNWKPVLGYESFYEVSTSGEVRRVGKKDSLKQKELEERDEHWTN